MPKAKKEKANEDILKLENSLSTERKEIFLRLKKHKWFQNTDPKVVRELTQLDEEFNGYLSDLSTRKDEIGGLQVLKLKKFLTSFKTVLNIFEVRVLQTNQIVEYEYVSAKYGKNPGFKGILLLEVDGKIKYFIIKKSERFAIGGDKVYDSLGGFIKFNHGILENFPKKVGDEIKRQLGLTTIDIKRFIDLGLMYPNVGLDSDHVSLFAAVINTDLAKNIKDLAGQHKTFKTKKNTFELAIIPVENIEEYIEKVDDSFFLACVVRLISRGIIKLN